MLGILVAWLNMSTTIFELSGGSALVVRWGNVPAGRGCRHLYPRDVLDVPGGARREGKPP